jgi:ABC-2 type transport system permease protein
MNTSGGFIRDTWFLFKRSILSIIRNPLTFVPNLIISMFFLLVYQAGLSGISSMPAFNGGGYLGFILPVSIVSGAIGGAGGAGQALVSDIERGYFARLLLTPVSRLAIVLGPMLAGMLQLLVQTVLILLVGFAMGLQVAAGIGGVFVVILIAAGFGLGFAGYSVAFALRSKNAQAAQAGTFIFFPLIFLSSTFVPMELIEAKWLQIAAKINPTTYIFEGMRSVLLRGWEFNALFGACVAIALLCILTITFAVISARQAVNRG